MTTPDTDSECQVCHRITLSYAVITDPHRGRVSATEKGNEP
jgi:hypothetical protein